jgi:hypothetical protein
MNGYGVFVNLLSVFLPLEVAISDTVCSIYDVAESNAPKGKGDKPATYMPC